MRAALVSDGELLSPEEKARVEAAITKAAFHGARRNRRHITLAMDDLEAETKDFAARRMDKSIRRAFAGKTVDEIGTDHEGKPNA